MMAFSTHEMPNLSGGPTRLKIPLCSPPTTNSFQPGVLAHGIRPPGLSATGLVVSPPAPFGFDIGYSTTLVILTVHLAPYVVPGPCSPSS